MKAADQITSQVIKPAMPRAYGKYLLWLALALPSFGMLTGVVRGTVSPHDMLHPTGEFAVRIMIVAMAAGPLAALFPRTRLCRWLLRGRRAFGVAGFGYALLHTAYYLLDKAKLTAVLGELLEASIWTGWMAFLLFVPLALTSNDSSVRVLGGRWKRLQRLAYPAALLSAAHWLLLEWHWLPMLVHFGPLAALFLARAIKRGMRRAPLVNATL